MLTPEYVQFMASYNLWMNEKIYKICEGLSDEERKTDRKAYFKSIHGTLNHILLGDKAWMGRFEGIPFIIKSLDQELYANFDELMAERKIIDTKIKRWADNILALDLSGELTYKSILTPGTKTCKLWMAVTHLFNHQTHHRGQVTTLLTQLDIDPGVTDLVFMPGVISSI